MKHKKMQVELTKLMIPAVLSLFLSLHYAAFAQSGESAARKFDEFGDVLPTDMAARLDNFAIGLQEDPNARGFLIVYRSHRDLPGLSSRHVNWMRGHLIYSRGIKADRIVAIDGGAALCLSHELWIAPPGAAPKPREDAYSRGFEDTDVARKYDEYYYTIPEDMLVSFSTEYEDGLEGYAQALRKEPRTLAYIIVYEQAWIQEWAHIDAERSTSKGGRRLRIDPPGTAWKELRGKKAELSSKHAVSPSRVRLINGGYRRSRAVELWIVSRGARPPIPTPNVYPPKRKRR
jgi:hypothetical protein